MNRRNFIRSAIVAPLAALFNLPAVGKMPTNKKQDISLINPDFGGFVDFPEQIIKIEKMGRWVIAFCEKSVWKMWLNHHHSWVWSRISNKPYLTERQVCFEGLYK